MIRRILAIGAVMAAGVTGLSPPSSPLVGVVVDALTREPVANAIVTIGSTETRTDGRGMFGASDFGASATSAHTTEYALC